MRIRPVLVAAAVLGAGLFAIPSGAASHSKVDACLQSVPEPGTTEPVDICYTLFRPAGADARHRVPLVFHSHGWGGSRSPEITSFTKWLDAGFGVLSFDQRGFGESGGKAHVEHPDYEGQDVERLVDLVAKQDWVQLDRPGDPRMGAIGGSYGGGYQMVGAFTSMMKRGSARFDALAPEITWFDLKESLAPQEVTRSLWTTALYAAGAEAHTTNVHAGLLFGAATGMWPNGEVPGVDLSLFFERNGPKWHVSQGRKLDIPVLYGQGETDTLFPLHQGLRNFEYAMTPRARAKSIFIGYNGGHTLPQVFPQGIGAAGDPCSKKLGGGSFSDLALKFMLQNLKGKPQRLTGFGRYHLATADNACVTVGSIKPNTKVALDQIVTNTGPGVAVAYELAQGPLTIAGTPSVSAAVTSLGVDQRMFMALSVGTTLADAKIVQNNVLPHRELLPTVGTKRIIELPSVAVDVPEGQSLFLTVTPFSDMFFGHGSRVPGVMTLADVVVNLPVVPLRS